MTLITVCCVVHNNSSRRSTKADNDCPRHCLAPARSLWPTPSGVQRRGGGQLLRLAHSVEACHADALPGAWLAPGSGGDQRSKQGAASPTGKFIKLL